MVDLAGGEEQRGEQQADAERNGDDQGQPAADGRLRFIGCPPNTWRARRSIWRAGFQAGPAQGVVIDLELQAAVVADQGDAAAIPGEAFGIADGQDRLPVDQRSTAPMRASSVSGMNSSWQSASCSGLLTFRDAQPRLAIWRPS